MKIKFSGLLFTTALLPAALLGQMVLNQAPSREVGHATLTIKTAAPNLLEGKELLGPDGIAVDTSSTPPILYVSDTGNNRVLAWRNASQFSKGAPADLVIGQPDQYTSIAVGPFNVNAPTGLAVDTNGNLFVADSGNSRILRYPAPFAQEQSFRVPDFVIGQASLNGGLANQGKTPSETTLALVSGSSAYLAALVFDAQGNLWATDAVNHRVLRYPAAAVQGNTMPVKADLVLGQPDFTTVKASDSLLKLDVMNLPAGLALDSGGRLFVSDALNRVLVYEPSFVSGKAARRLVAGTNTLAPGQSTPTDFNLSSPQGVFVAGDRLFIIDTFNHRVLRYEVYKNWPTDFVQFNPGTVVPFPILVPPRPDIAPMGQESFVARKPNKGLAEPSEVTLSLPTQGAFAAGELFLADSGNNRVLVFGDPSLGASGFIARRVLGQMDLQFNAPNLIEGKEMYLSNRSMSGGGIAVDTASNPPHLYIADTNNNRVLGYRDLRKAKAGDTVDLVIGQPDFYRAVPNYPSGNVNAVTPTDSGLSTPTTVAVDSDGNLWVADFGNGRVVRFPKPFDQPVAVGQKADLVIGQASFTSSVFQPTDRTMEGPFGLAFSVDGHLFVSDLVDNRVLLFKKPFSRGMAAANVIGQPDYTTKARRDVTDKKLNAPHGMATDSSDRLYLCDTNNNRVVIYDRAVSAPLDPNPTQPGLTGMSVPFGVTINSASGEIWVAHTGGNEARRYPRFEELPLNDFKPNFSVGSNGPLSVALDSFGNLVASESINRVALFFPSIKTMVNAANYQAKPIAPMEIVTIFSDMKLSDTSAIFNGTYPWPTDLADTQILVNGQPSPLYYVYPNQISFVTPKNMPTSGQVEVQVVKKSLGQIKAVSMFQTAESSPALFTADATGLGQLAALNEDYTVNSIGNPVQRGHYISFYGTGQGLVADAPDDGYPAPGAVPTDVKPTVYINGIAIDTSNVQYSGLAPGLVGLWQVNVMIPMSVAPGQSIPVLLSYKSNFTLVTGRTTISVKQ